MFLSSLHSACSQLPHNLSLPPFPLHPSGLVMLETTLCPLSRGQHLFEFTHCICKRHHYYFCYRTLSHTIAHPSSHCCILKTSSWSIHALLVLHLFHHRYAKARCTRARCTRHSLHFPRRTSVDHTHVPTSHPFMHIQAPHMHTRTHIHPSLLLLTVLFAIFMMISAEFLPL